MTTNTKVLMRYKYRREMKEKYVTFGLVAQWTREAKYSQRVNAVRGMDDVPTEVGMANGPAAAEWLPTVYPARGIMPQKGAKAGYTGLVLLSFRVTTGQAQLEQLRRMVNLWEQTLLSFVGSSGQSLKVLMPYTLTDGTLPTDEAQAALFQQYAYKRAAEYALASTGYRPEEVAHDGTEHFHLSSDPAVYLNLEARPIRMPQPTETLSTETPPLVSQPAEVSLDTDVLPGYTRREMDTMKFNTIFRNLSYDKLCELEDHLMRLAVMCCRSGIDQELAVRLTIEALRCWEKEELVRMTFQTAYEEHPLGRHNPIERTMIHQLLLEKFLRRRYMFRRNSVTGEVEYQEKFRYELWWKPLTQEAQNDINNAAIHEGIKVWPQDRQRLLVSEHIESYDPVREWLNALPQWDGRDRLGELTDRVKTKSSGWHDNFKIWMRSMVSQWMSGANAMYGAQMVLMLVGGQGTHKSTFMRLLLPPKLMPFYIDRIDFTNKKEALRALSRFLLINIDEYDQISKAQTAFLKHLIQRTDVKERRLYSTTFEQQQRYAAFCATTNSLVPLKDESGSRRYLVAEVTDAIDTDTEGEKKIDYQQLYAQIVYEIKHGEEYAFTGDRERSIQEQNADYYETPGVISLFDDLFHQPQAGDATLTLSPTEILQYIKEARKVNVITQANATLIGTYLSRKGFSRGEGRQRRKYIVAQNG